MGNNSVWDKTAELINTAIDVNLSETFEFLEKQKQVKVLKIKSKFPTINGLEMKILKVQKCIEFSTGPLLSCKNPAQYQIFAYGFNKPFELIDSNNLYSVKNGVGTVGIGMGTPNNGKLYELDSNFKTDTGFFRAIFPINDSTKVPVDYLLGCHFKVGNSLRGFGYVQIEVEGYQIGFYDYTLNDQKYIFIDCKNRIGHTIFEKLVEALIYSFGLISGSLVRDEITILKFDKPEFISLLGFQFRKLEDSIISDLELINPQQHKEYEKLTERIFFPEKIFATLATNCFNNAKLLRPIKIINKSRALPLELQAASIFVALETVTRIIIDENLDKLSPFKEGEFASSVINELIEKINNLSESNFNNKEAVIKRIKNLNQIGNKDKFLLAFERVGFELTKEDKNIISMRDKFLHGSIPFSDEPEQKRKNELQKITLNAHLLTCSLILKYVKYNGVVKNFLKYLDIVRNSNEIKAPLFRHI